MAGVKRSCVNPGVMVEVTGTYAVRDWQAYREGWSKVFWMGILLLGNVVAGFIPFVGQIASVVIIILLLVFWWQAGKFLAQAYEDPRVFQIVRRAVIASGIAFVASIIVLFLAFVALVGASREIISAAESGDQALSQSAVVEMLIEMVGASVLGTVVVVVMLVAGVIGLIYSLLFVWRLYRYTENPLFKWGVYLTITIILAVVGGLLILIGYLVEGSKRKSEMGESGSGSGSLTT